MRRGGDSKSTNLASIRPRIRNPVEVGPRVRPTNHPRENNDGEGGDQDRDRLLPVAAVAGEAVVVGEAAAAGKAA